MCDELDSQLRLTAKLYYVDGLDQTQVAELVGVSRSQVSRLLSRARERGLVRISVDEYDPRNRVLEDQLRRLCHLNHAIVVRTLACATPDSVRHTVGYLAAPVVSELVQSNTILGVAGGRTLCELVRHMQPTAGTQGVAVAQLMGNIGPTVGNADAIELSHTLAQSFKGVLYTLNAPAYSLDPRTRDAFLTHQHIQAIWQVFRVMQIALVGIGSLEDSSFIERGTLEPSDMEQIREKGAVGEICGRFFDSRGQECTTDYRDRVIGIELDELHQKPEVIGVTSGQGKIEAIYAACCGGLIKSLVIDEASAQALVARATGERSAGDRSDALSKGVGNDTIY